MSVRLREELERVQAEKNAAIRRCESFVVEIAALRSECARLAKQVDENLSKIIDLENPWHYPQSRPVLTGLPSSGAKTKY